jgi:hypothetical protein
MPNAGLASVSAIAFAALVGVGAAPGSPPAGDDAGSARAIMTCERAIAPGRARCEVEARVDAGDSIAWGDVTLVQVPPFVTALRGRVGPHDASVREPGLWRWTFALVARAAGTGGAVARVRIVVCRDAACTPREVEVTAVVEAGADR